MIKTYLDCRGRQTIFAHPPEDREKHLCGAVIMAAEDLKIPRLGKGFFVFAECAFLVENGACPKYANPYPQYPAGGRE